ncbi:MAG: LLM class flavin-dependent oxidoreductase [Actinobacteria bacterium]|nr:MAG: LLM class flavin-dependent oxidoreductase [Actinomycetota bacterium]
MKALWFHLMPYPALDERFDREAHSAWVDLDPSFLDGAVMHRAYNTYLDQLEHAAAAGFDGICVNEHHQSAYGMVPSPNLMAAALVRRTERTAIVVMGNSLALYNPPLRVAEELAMLDVLSGGRLVAGFPVGTSMDTCYSYGINPGQLRARYAEAHDLIMQAWRSPKPFAFNGRYTKLRYVNSSPRPLQQPHPPVWIPGGGSSVETWDLAATHDYVYAYLSYYGYESGKLTMDGFWQYVTDRGLDDNPYRAAFLIAQDRRGLRRGAGLSKRSHLSQFALVASAPRRTRRRRRTTDLRRHRRSRMGYRRLAGHGARAAQRLDH